jgi:ABC-type Na+ efflux pump permease subunit
MSGGRIRLIAAREFKAYAMTLSFWVALVIAPALLAAGMFLANDGGASRPTPPATLTLSTGSGGETVVRLSPGFPLSADGRAQIVRLFANDGGRAKDVRLEDQAAPVQSVETMTRLVLVMMLWMTLTGALGMLLQATVRERSNRALESLLAAAPAWEIVAGKLIGVGAVSALVIGTWLGSSAGLLAIAPDAQGPVAALAHGLAHPLLLLRAGLIYILAFAFYGLMTIALGASARDNAQAQNMARPMFALLLAVFFVALSAAGGGARGLAWLVYAPPFTPFMLLLQHHSLADETIAFALLAAATTIAGAAAMRAMRAGPPSTALDSLLAVFRRA